VRRVSISISAHLDRCCGTEVPLVGSYIANAPREAQLVDTADGGSCPHCGGLMRMAAPGVQAARIVALDGQPDGDIQPVCVEDVPPHLVLVSCRSCRQHWVRPR
jgi:hypothetical protein